MVWEDWRALEDNFNPHFDGITNHQHWPDIHITIINFTHKLNPPYWPLHLTDHQSSTLTDTHITIINHEFSIIFTKYWIHSFSLIPSSTTILIIIILFQRIDHQHSYHFIILTLRKSIESKDSNTNIFREPRRKGKEELIRGKTAVLTLLLVHLELRYCSGKLDPFHSVPSNYCYHVIDLGL